MKYRKLQNIKCDENGTPLLIQDCRIRGCMGQLVLEITLFNNIKDDITVEAFNDVTGNNIGYDMLGQHLDLTDDIRSDLEKLCIDFEIVDEACQAYGWLENYQNGDYVDSYTTIDIRVLQEQEQIQLQEEELRKKIDQLIKDFIPARDYIIDKDSLDKYAIMIPKLQQIVARGNDLRELHSSLIDYINIKSLTPLEYLTKMAGELLKHHHKDNYERY